MMFLNFVNSLLSSTFVRSSGAFGREINSVKINDLNAFYLNKRHLDRLLSCLSRERQDNNLNPKKVFFTELELVGLGYRVSLRKSRIRLSLGYSHVIFLVVPKTVSIIKRRYKILLYSKNCAELGLFVSTLLKFKKLNPYKIKGLKERRLIYKLKPGKRSK